MSKFPNISSFYQSVSGWVAKAPDINANMGPVNLKSQLRSKEAGDNLPVSLLSVLDHPFLMLQKAHIKCNL